MNTLRDFEHGAWEDAEVRFWHIADVPVGLMNVCSWGKRGHP